MTGIEVTAWEVDHPSGAPPLALRLGFGGTTVAYTGDTAWTGSLVTAADGADLLIAEAYYYDKAIPYHLRHADLAAHRASLTSGPDRAHPHVYRHARQGGGEPARLRDRPRRPDHRALSVACTAGGALTGSTGS